MLVFGWSSIGVLGLVVLAIIAPPLALLLVVVGPVVLMARRRARVTASWAANQYGANYGPVPVRRAGRL